MDLKRLRYFCAVIEQGNVSKAARFLNIAQPALSKRLSELEEEIGALLFLRGIRHIEATPAGLHLYRRACEILQSVDNATRETIIISKTETQTLRIGVSHLYQRFFQSLILEIHRRHPDIHIRLTVSDSSYIEMLLRNGLIDVALIQKPSNPSGYDCLNFQPISAVAVMTPTLAKDLPDRALSLCEIAKFPLMLLRRGEGPGIYELVKDRLERASGDLKAVMSVSQPSVILDWIETGLDCASILPASEVDQEKWKHCRVFTISSTFAAFYPSIVKMSASSHMAAVMDIVKDGQWNSALAERG